MSAADPRLQKSQCRKQMRQRRRALSRAQQQQAALKVAKRLAGLKAFKKAQHIAFYLANDGELSPHALIQLALRHGKNCYLPRICGERMRFHRYQSKDKLSKNKFGIEEPLHSSPERLVKQLDLVCMPLVAYDLTGNRLGMGGGYYDRAFSFRTRRHLKRPLLVGLAHGCQQVETLTTEPWDQTLDYIVSDKHCLKF
ncbi:5-formyltetrahydrofolate cyclo-ligase [Agaribacterium sp. ZY112]|uniref:5-formyltetrahydrofolate cyclo-ligase n=1 Tax=Agaribacterium sp. ZY112 TaxID=3233574 RepID=UPI003523FD29